MEAQIWYDSTDGRIAVPELSRTFEATTDIGLRPTQEDRFVLAPTFCRSDLSLMAVFDGTVGPDASHFCQNVSYSWLLMILFSSW